MSRVLSSLGNLASFVEHTEFTKVQERVIPSLMQSKENAVIAAPTGSGKTLLLEVAALDLFRARLVAAGAPTAGSVCLSEPAAPPALASAKAVYICPIKALANEKYAHWRRMFAPLSVVIETGDQGRERLPDENFAEVSAADLILTTPERWDSITRRWKEKEVLGIVYSVELLLLDEVHTVREDRGAALEAVVSRMKAIKAAMQQQHQAPCGGTLHGRGTSIRFVATSGTLPNIEDFAEWLQAPPHMVFSFSNEDRPVPLYIKVISYTSDSSNPFVFARFLSFKLFGLIRQYGDDRPSMIFCASRKEAVLSAQRILQDIRQIAEREDRKRHLQPSLEVQELCNQANDRQLRELLAVGIAYHHAALSFQDRQLVERMFRDQYIAVLCTTTTLALGVNLPAHLVVIKGTTFFKSGKQEDVPLSEVAQMCGRAGRPGMDNCGVALVLTTENKAALYESLQHGDVYTTVESQLHRHMVEHVNAEIALRTIHSFASGLRWAQTTFFWIRLRKCPQHYGLRFATKAEENAFSPESFVESLMERVIKSLHEEGCIELRACHTCLEKAKTAPTAVGGGCGEEQGLHPCAAPLPLSLSRPLVATSTLGRDAVVESTRVGRSMARLYTLFATVRTFNEQIRLCRRASGVALTSSTSEDVGVAQTNGNVAKKDNDSDDTHTEAKLLNVVGPLKTRFRLSIVLRLLSRAEEFAEIRLRQGDRGPLNDLNKCVRLPLSSGKRGGREVREDWHKVYVLIQVHIAQLPITDISLRNDCARLWLLVPRVMRFTCDYAWSIGSFSFVTHANLLLRCIEQRVWPDGLLLRQLDGVNEAVASALAQSGYRRIESIFSVDPRKLEVICGKLPPYGAQLQAIAREIPTCELTVRRERSPPYSKDDTRMCSFSKGRHFTISVRPKAHVAGNSSFTGCLSGWKKNRIRSFLLVVGNTSSDQILLQRSLPILSIFAASVAGERDASSNAHCAFPSVSFQFFVPAELLASPPCHLVVSLITEHWVGSDVVLSFDAATAVAGWDLQCSVPAGMDSAVDATHTAVDFSLSKPDFEPSVDATCPVGQDGQVALSASIGPTVSLPQAKGDGLYAEITETARASFAALLRDLEYVQGAPGKGHRKVVGCGSRKALGRRHKGATDTAPQPPIIQPDEVPSVASVDPSTASPKQSIQSSGSDIGSRKNVRCRMEPVACEQGRVSLLVPPLEGAAMPTCQSREEAAAPIKLAAMTRSPQREALPIDQAPQRRDEQRERLTIEEDHHTLDIAGARQIYLRPCKSPEPSQQATTLIPPAFAATNKTHIFQPDGVGPVGGDGERGVGSCPHHVCNASQPTAPPVSLPLSWRHPMAHIQSPISLTNVACEKRERSEEDLQSNVRRRFSFRVQCRTAADPPLSRCLDRHEDFSAWSASAGGLQGHSTPRYTPQDAPAVILPAPEHVGSHRHSAYTWESPGREFRQPSYWDSRPCDYFNQSAEASPHLLSGFATEEQLYYQPADAIAHESASVWPRCRPWADSYTGPCAGYRSFMDRGSGKQRGASSSVHAQFPSHAAVMGHHCNNLGPPSAAQPRMAPQAPHRPLAYDTPFCPGAPFLHCPYQLPITAPVPSPLRWQTYPPSVLASVAGQPVSLCEGAARRAHAIRQSWW